MDAAFKRDINVKALSYIMREINPRLYLSVKLLPDEARLATYCLYALFYADRESPRNQKGVPYEQRVSNLKNSIEQIYSGKDLNNAILVYLRALTQKYAVPQKYFYDLLDGVRLTRNPIGFPTYADLHRYCYKTSGALMWIIWRILNPADEYIAPYAINFGIGICLSEIVSNIEEDGRLGKIYFATEDLKSYQVSEKELIAKTKSANIRPLIELYTKRAGDYLQNASVGIQMLKSWRARLAMSRLKGSYQKKLYRALKTRL